jgi:hypothetical protein
VLLGNGDGSFQPPTDFTVGTSMHASPFSLKMADLTGSGVLDLVTANYNDDNVSVLLGNGDGSFQAVQNYTADIGPTSVAVGDFNRDGFPDLAVTNRFGNDVSILLNQADWRSVPGGAHRSPAPTSTGEISTGLPAADPALATLALSGPSTPQLQALPPAPTTAGTPATDQGQRDRFFAIFGGADQPAALLLPRLETRAETAESVGLADPLAANPRKAVGDW